MKTASTFALPSLKRRASLAKSTEKYSDHLLAAQEYLTGRGIATDDVLSWRWGVVVEPEPEHERMQGRLAIPYLTPAGPVAIKFRCMQEHDCKEQGHPKYDSEAGQGTFLFGVTAFDVESQVIGVCEGEIDAFVASSMGGIPTVATTGSTKWQPHWKYCFEGYDEVIVWQDGSGNERAGTQFAANVAKHFYNARVVPMPKGHDINTYVHEFGAQALRDRADIR